MSQDLSDGELIKSVRGARTQEEFSDQLGLPRTMISHYERGAVKPSSAAWLKMAESVTYPYNVYCWQRAGLPRHTISLILQGMRERDNFDYAYPPDLERPQAREFLASQLPPAEPVTEPLADEPVEGEPAELKSPSTTLEEFHKHHGFHLLPTAETSATDTRPKKDKAKRRRKR